MKLANGDRGTMQSSDHPLKPENLGQGHKRPRPQPLLCHRLPGDLEQIPLSLGTSGKDRLGLGGPAGQPGACGL